MEIRPAERLILIMLTDLLDAAKAKTRIDTALVRKAVAQGHFWALDWDMPFVDAYDDMRAVVDEVAEILELHAVLEASYAALPARERERIGAVEPLAFHGFDAEREGAQHEIARFLIAEMGRFPAFEGRALDAPAPTLAASRALLRALRAARPGEALTTQTRLTAEELRAILAG